MAQGSLGTLIEAWASHKSFQRKDGNDKPGSGAGGNFHGEMRSNDTHESKTDPEARLYKKASGQDAKLSCLGYVLVENRKGRSQGIRYEGFRLHGQRVTSHAPRFAEHG